MIWGLTLQPGELHTEIVKDEIQLSMAALESRDPEAGVETSMYNQVVIQTESAEYVLCTLVHGIQFQQYLDIKLVPGEKISFSVNGKYIVHLIGYSSCLPATHNNDRNEEREEAPMYHVQAFKEEPPNDEHSIEISVPNESFPELGEVSQQIAGSVSPARSQRQIHVQETTQPSPHQAHQESNVLQNRNSLRQQQYQQRMRRRYVGNQRSMLQQQRRHSRVFPISGMRRTFQSKTGPRIRVRPVTPLGAHKPAYATTQLPVQTVHQLQVQSQQVMQEAVNIPSNMEMVAHANISNQDTPSSFPITVQVTGLAEGEQISDVCGGTSMEDIPCSSGTKLEENIPHVIGNVENNLPNISGMNSSLSNTEQSHMLSAYSMSEGGSSESAIQRLSNSEIVHPAQRISDQEGDAAIIFVSDHMSSSWGEMHSSGFQCQFCLRHFEDLASCRIHEDSIHMDIKMRQCNICGKVLKSHGILKQHLVVHRAERRFKCRYCGKAFVQARDMRRHENVHTGNRPFLCRYCSKTFTQGGTRVQHERKEHPNEYKPRNSSSSHLDVSHMQ